MKEYIDKESFLEHMKKTDRYFAVKSDIEEFPAADVVERKRGEWKIAERNMLEKTLIVECSECNAVFELPMTVFGLNYNGCPNCLADMRGEKHENQ